MVCSHQVLALGVHLYPVELLAAALQDADCLAAEDIPVADLPIRACTVQQAVRLSAQHGSRLDYRPGWPVLYAELRLRSGPIFALVRGTSDCGACGGKQAC